MAYTNIMAVNEILVDSNEVELTEAGFGAARGIQKAAKNYINKAYMEIIGKDVEWPFLSTAESNAYEPYSGNVTTESDTGTRWYQLKPAATGVASDFGKVDWESFYLTTQGVAGATEPYIHQNLDYISYDEWSRHLREQENSDASGEQTYGIPTRVTQSMDGRYFGLSPIPDGAYKIIFTAWDRATRLANASDVIKIPDEYIPVLLNRANYYLLHWKKDFNEADRVNTLFTAGLKEMERALLGNPNNTMTDDRIRY